MYVFIYILVYFVHLEDLRERDSCRKRRQVVRKQQKRKQKRRRSLEEGRVMEGQESVLGNEVLSEELSLSLPWSGSVLGRSFHQPGCWDKQTFPRRAERSRANFSLLSEYFSKYEQTHS